MILSVDSRLFNGIPPLRARWAPVGQPARVPIVAARDTRVLTGVLNIKSGTWLSELSDRYRQGHFQQVLRRIRAHWRGWRIVLFLDRHPARRAHRSRQLADQLKFELRWLPTACPELNVVDHLWRPVIQEVLANEPTPCLEHTVQRAEHYLASLSPKERLNKAGGLSESFWLSDVIGR